MYFCSCNIYIRIFNNILYAVSIVQTAIPSTGVHADLQENIWAQYPNFYSLLDSFNKIIFIYELKISEVLNFGISNTENVIQLKGRIVYINAYPKYWLLKIVKIIRKSFSN